MNCNNLSNGILLQFEINKNFVNLTIDLVDLLITLYLYEQWKKEKRILYFRIHRYKMKPGNIFEYWKAALKLFVSLSIGRTYTQK